MRRRVAVVTGGAGFIGSHVAQGLLDEGYDVRVLDDLSSGNIDNVPTSADLVVGDAADATVTNAVIQGADVVLHQAAHRAVLKSVEDPLATDTANVHGTVAVLDASRRAGVQRVVYASSSSVYGGSDVLPTPERTPSVPRSPYAVSKLAGEQYCRVFAELYGLETVALRYFNVFGPRQRPDSAYTAVIPLFIDALARGEAPTIHGDGRQTRDFTYVSDVVRANLAAVAAPGERCSGHAYNISGGKRSSLIELLERLEKLVGRRVEPRFASPRSGDVRHSEADITAAGSDLGYVPLVGFHAGLRETVAWQMACARADET